jgi:hypothetical protein
MGVATTLDHAMDPDPDVAAVVSAVDVAAIVDAVDVAAVVDAADVAAIVPALHRAWMDSGMTAEIEASAVTDPTTLRLNHALAVNQCATYASAARKPSRGDSRMASASNPTVRVVLSTALAVKEPVAVFCFTASALNAATATSRRLASTRNVAEAVLLAIPLALNALVTVARMTALAVNDLTFLANRCASAVKADDVV